MDIFQDFDQTTERLQELLYSFASNVESRMLGSGTLKETLMHHLKQKDFAQANSVFFHSDLQHHLPRMKDLGPNPLRHDVFLHAWSFFLTRLHQSSHPQLTLKLIENEVARIDLGVLFETFEIRTPPQEHQAIQPLTPVLTYAKAFNHSAVHHALRMAKVWQNEGKVKENLNVNFGAPVLYKSPKDANEWLNNFACVCEPAVTLSDLQRVLEQDYLKIYRLVQSSDAIMGQVLALPQNDTLSVSPPFIDADQVGQARNKILERGDGTTSPPMSRNR